ncbi:dienelactone hydrolase family protein, partial [Mycobacterium tuberculosis]|nr:dienelactone hydrolase family protein [Mycobacterium tuberculosis]
MTPLQRYIAEEIATDHLDGLLSRREALRRLSLLGIGAAAAAALITACGETQQSSPGPSPSAAPETTTSRTASPPGLE